MNLRQLFRPQSKHPPVTAESIEARRTGRISFSRPAGRAAWDNGFFSLSRLSGVPQGANLALYEHLREAVPVIEAAIGHLKRFVGVPRVESADEAAKQDLQTWLDSLRVNRLQTGFGNWFPTWLDSALLYGRSHAELILTRDQQDIWGIQQLHTRTIALRPRADGYQLDVVQYQPLGLDPVIIPPALCLNALHDVRDDNPHGTSILWGMPFMAEILVGMVKSLGQTWQRFGVPTYHVNWEPPEDFSDPTGEIAGRYMAGVETDFYTALQSRASADVKDFFTSGKMSVDVIGAEGETLNFEVPGRALVEQIVARTGLPPFLFGLQWATTERMSFVQAGLLERLITSIRTAVDGELHYLLDLRQRMTGQSRSIELEWEAPSVVDEFEQARSELLQSQAEAQKLKVLREEWTLGLRTDLEVVRERRPDLAMLSDGEIRARLPMLLATPPAAPMLPEGFGPEGREDQEERLNPGNQLRRGLTYNGKLR